MKLKLYLIVALLFAEIVLPAQSSTMNYYWVQFKDKKGTAFQVNHPEAFLSQRALARRARQHIAIDETDLPVSKVYLDTLRKRGFEIVHSSKWLNGTTVRTADTSMVRKAKGLPFISLIQQTRPGVLTKSGHSKFTVPELQAGTDPLNYGNAYNQLKQLNGQFLHNQGFRGKGIQIAVLDAGFWKVNVAAAFDSLRLGKRILGIRDFVDPKSDFYNTHTHGTSVLSCMAANVPGTMVGTAPDASYYLFRSEQDPTEYLVEEDNWVAAAELADSVGVDVINSSLGYNQFDDPSTNHVYADLNGDKTRITRGANMAFQKGILVVNSAGNEGNNAWKKIIAPADGKNVLAVAAVDKNGTRASFSSLGPAFGGAIKPNVAAMGGSTFLVTNSSGNPIFYYASGTSFSSPVLAGMAACLMQANPYANVRQVKLAIEQSSLQFSKPDSLLGYGIPDFAKADQYLKTNYSQSLSRNNFWSISPNPFLDVLTIQCSEPTAEKVKIRISDLQGKIVWQSEYNIQDRIVITDCGNLPSGILILTLSGGSRSEQFKLVRINR